MPRMPLSGVRISWLTMARKRDLARFAASAWSRAGLQRALGFDAVGDVAADALHFGAASVRTVTSRQATQRASNHLRRLFLVVHPRCRRPERPVRVFSIQYRQQRHLADQGIAGLAGECAEGVIGA